MKNIYITIAIGFLNLAGCGSDASAPVANVPDPNIVAGENDSNVDRNAIAALSSGHCDNAYLTNSWRIGYSDFVQIKKDCLFESFVCGAVGFIDSDVNMLQAGFADIEITSFVQPSGTTHCMPKGRYRCAFDTRGMTGYLDLACNPQ